MVGKTATDAETSTSTRSNPNSTNHTPQKHVKKVENWSEKLISSSPRITFLMRELREKGVESILVKCMNCSINNSKSQSGSIGADKAGENNASKAMSGGFSPTKGILICAETIDSKASLEDNLSHELIHAYDNATIKNFSLLNLKHLACSEIRAVNTSGECRFTREFRRGKVFGSIGKHHQECVKRRSILGVMQSGKVDEKEAERLVLNAWSHCFPDTAPYEEIY